jgi:glycosyltransferase involved in cell wall biosynthesis
VKGIGVLFDAAARMPDAQFLLFSDVPPELLGGRKVYGFDNVVSMGGYRRSDMGVLSNLFDLAVVPSLCESWGLVKRELETLGCKVIATDAGGLGGNVRPNDPEALAEAIRRGLEGIHTGLCAGVRA